MTTSTAIEWTDATWNPLLGCTKISPGCKHCYAETLAERFRDTPNHPFEHGFDLRLVPEKLMEPLKWTRPRRVFVNSMSDLFHEAVPVSYIQAVFLVMAQAHWHTFQVLTKRHERMALLLRSREITAPPNVWLGVSIENNRHGLPRIEALREAPGEFVRFLSIEPLLESLDWFSDYTGGIDWVIVGGESGPGARPLHIDWVRAIRDRCQEGGVPFFFKQWGGVRKGPAGRELDGRTWDEMPEIGTATAPSPKERKAIVETLRTVIGSDAYLASIRLLNAPNIDLIRHIKGKWPGSSPGTTTGSGVSTTSQPLEPATGRALQGRRWPHEL